MAAEAFLSHVVFRFLRNIAPLFAVALAARLWECAQVAGEGLIPAHAARGFASDAAVSALVALVMLPCGARLRWIPIGLWCAFTAGNAAFIGANQANIRLDFLVAGEQGAFLRGSVFTPALLMAAVGLVGVAIGADRLAARLFRFPFARRGVLAVVALLALSPIFPLSSAAFLWPQQHALAENIRTLALRQVIPTLGNPSTLPPEMRERYFARDLSGKPFLASASKPNVLLITVESFSHVHMEQGLLPQMARWRERGMYYPNIIAQQRQTHTGMHVLLCGETPNLSNRESKAEIAVTLGQPRPCLPNLLRGAGWRTEYMQAADLPFMRKDALMREIGFDVIKGESDFPGVRRGGEWGLDDATLFDIAAQRVEALRMEGKPWFLTVLTVGTHHPFMASPEWMRKANGDAYAASFMAADAAVGALLDRLEAAGALKDTLVIITSDESNAHSVQSGLQGMLSTNHGFLLVLAPEAEPREERDYFVQADIPLGVLDYAGMAEESGMGGRSVFRHYASFRPALFAQLYLDKLYIWDTPQRLIACDQAITRCMAVRVPENGVFSGEPLMAEAAFGLESLAKMLAAYNDWRQGGAGERRGVQVAAGENRSNFNIFSMLKTNVLKGDIAEWSIRLHTGRNNTRPVKFWFVVYAVTEEGYEQRRELKRYEIRLPQNRPFVFTWRYPVHKPMMLESHAGINADKAQTVLLEEGVLEIQGSKSGAEE